MRRPRSARPDHRRPLPITVERLEERRVLATFATSGTALSIDLNSAGTLAVTTSGTGNYLFTLEGGDTFSGTDASGLVGNGLATLTVTSALDLSQVNLTNSAGTTAVRFADSTGTYVDSFDVKLGGIPGLTGWVPSVKFVGRTPFAAAAALAVTAPTVAVEAGTVSTVSGALTLTGDTGTSFDGNYTGVTLSQASLVSTDSGSITIVGRGGLGVNGNQNGVAVGPGSNVQAGSETSAVAVPLSITGVGGAAAGSGGNNHGIVLETGSGISAAGPLSLVGTGGSTNSGDRGVLVSGRVSTVRPIDRTAAPITITGTGGGVAGSSAVGNDGVSLGSKSNVSGDGSILVTGTRGAKKSDTIPDSSVGISLDSAHLDDHDGPITFKADSFRLQGTGGAISTGGTVAFQNTVANQVMPLDKSVNAVLARTYAKTIEYGTSTAVIEQDVTAAGGALVVGAANLTVAGSAIRLRSAVTSGGAQTWTGPVTLGLATPVKSVAADDVRLTGNGIVFTDTVDGAKNLALVAGAAPIRFAGAVGKATPLASLSVESASAVKAESSVNTDGTAPGASKNGLTFAPGVNGIDMQVAGSTILNATGDGIVLGSTSGSSLAGFTVKNAGGAGIRATGAMPSTQITATRVESGGKASYGAHLTDTTGLSLGTATAGNTFTGVSTGIVATGDMTGAGIRSNSVTGNSAGINLVAARGLEVSANKIATNTLYGIRAEGNDAGSVVKGNTITGGAAGVLLEAARGLTVGGAGTGNLIQAGVNASTSKYDATRTSHGLRATGDLTGTTVVGNTITDNTIGMNLVDARGLAVRDGNLVYRSRFQGIAVKGTSTSTVIRGTTVDGSLPDGSRAPLGIWLSSATGLAVGGDAAKDANGVYSTTTAVWASGALTGSTLKRTIIRSTSHGIVLTGARGFWVQSNDVTGAARQGLNASGDCTGTTVLFNRIQTGEAGIVIDAARSLAVKNNVVESNRTVGVFATGNCTGTKVSDNAIVRNATNLSTSRASGGWFQPS